MPEVGSTHWFPWFKPPNPQALRARPLVVPRAHPNYDAETLEQNWVAPQSSLYEMDVNCGFCRALWKMNELGLDSCELRAGSL